MAKTKLIPGFRFHPTDVELLKYFLKRKVMGKKFFVDVIAEADIYKYAPWDLPDKSCLRTGDLEWYFFCPREKKYASGARMNRATEFGFWKTTGKDRDVHYNSQIVGKIKTLVFHRGKASHGDRTDWVMHEYRLQDKELSEGIPQDSYVLCKVFQKDGPGPRNGAQYGRPFNEEDWDDDEEIDGVGSVPLAAMSAPVPILPVTHNSSVATDMHPPVSGYTGSSSMSCLSGVMPSPCPMLPSVPSDQVILNDSPQAPVDDDISLMLDWFTEDNTLALNENETEKIDNSVQGKDAEVAPCLDVNDIFKDLGDLENLPGWGDGQHCVKEAECNTNQMFPLEFGDRDFLELHDLDSPLFQHTEQPENWGLSDPQKEGLVVPANSDENAD